MHKVARKEMTWEHIFLLCFPREYFTTLKDHIIEVSNVNEWEPTLIHLVQFIAVELAMCFYNKSPTEYFKRPGLYPMLPRGGIGSLSVTEYHCILNLLGREKKWTNPETLMWKNPQMR